MVQHMIEVVQWSCAVHLFAQLRVTRQVLACQTSRAHSQPHTRTHAHARTHTYTHTHTNTCATEIPTQL